jgi:hypothetical protein
MVLVLSVVSPGIGAARDSTDTPGNGKVEPQIVGRITSKPAIRSAAGLAQRWPGGYQ